MDALQAAPDTALLEQKEYVKAHDAYLRMAIGNAPWPMVSEWSSRSRNSLPVVCLFVHTRRNHRVLPWLVFTSAPLERRSFRTKLPVSYLAGELVWTLIELAPLPVIA